MKTRHAIAAVLALFACATFAHADARSTMEYFCPADTPAPAWKKQCFDGPPSKQRVTVFISPAGQDSGRPGNFYIGLRTDGNIRGLFDGSQWVGTEGGLFPPAATVQDLNTQSFVVINDFLICGMAGYGKHELWAGYGALDAEKEALVENYHRAANPNHTPQYMRQVYMQNDMTRGEKAWNVLKFDCEKFVDTP
ncbi:MAG: hypothetical protein Q7K57_46555 [Burkholderiaceae bacterium]|nr:hypothetical protein [Polaromonas sp.]MDO8776050.1 hypothetical protein [Burkholderiaceae bacterium]